MARIRTIKPEFWSSGQVLECSATTRLMFIGLWNFCDDHGRHPLRPKQIKAQIFPADDISTDAILGMVQELEKNGLIITYTVEKEEYLQVTGWHNQRIDKRQSAKYPPPPNDHSKNDRRTLPPEGKGREGIGEEGKESAPNGAARDFQNSVQPRPAQKPNREIHGSDEDEFWARAGDLEAQGVSRSRCGQLANLLNGDFAEGLDILRDVAGAKEPSKYLGAIIRNRKAEQRSAAAEPGVPDWVSDARSQGYAVTREGERWRMAGALYDDAGEQVGC